jgi:hypothetical protein
VARGKSEELEAMNIHNRMIDEVISALPKNGDFSLEHAYEEMLRTFPRYAVTKGRLSQAIIKTGKFESWKEKDMRMFRYRRT